MSRADDTLPGGWRLEEDGVLRHPRFPRGNVMTQPDSGVTLTHEGLTDEVALSVVAPDGRAPLNFYQLGGLSSALWKAFDAWGIHPHVRTAPANGVALRYDPVTNGAVLTVPFPHVIMDREQASALMAEVREATHACQTENGRLGEEKEALIRAAGPRPRMNADGTRAPNAPRYYIEYRKEDGTWVEAARGDNHRLAANIGRKYGVPVRVIRWDGRVLWSLDAPEPSRESRPVRMR